MMVLIMSSIIGIPLRYAHRKDTETNVNLSVPSTDSGHDSLDRSCAFIEIIASSAGAKQSHQRKDCFVA